MKKEFRLSLASDYAVLHTEKFSFYYGYEKTQDDEWCFVATDNGSKIELLRLPTSKLEELSGKKGEVPEAYLLVGIGYFFNYELAHDEPNR